MADIRSQTSSSEEKKQQPEDTKKDSSQTKTEDQRRPEEDACSKDVKSTTESSPSTKSSSSTEQGSAKKGLFGSWINYLTTSEGKKKVEGDDSTTKSSSKPKTGDHHDSHTISVPPPKEAEASEKSKHDMIKDNTTNKDDNRSESIKKKEPQEEEEEDDKVTQTKVEVLPYKKKILIILDLNDVLICRVRTDIRNRMIKNNSWPTLRRFKFHDDVYIRPNLDPFLDFLFAHFYVGIWSSAKLYNIQTLLERTMNHKQRSQLQFIMHQDDCKIVNRRRPLLPLKLKPMSRLWQSKQYNPDCLFDDLNTLFIDDSYEANEENMANCVVIPTFDVSYPDCNDDGVLNELIQYLKPLTKLPEPVDVQKYIAEHPFRSAYSRVDNIENILDQLSF